MRQDSDSPRYKETFKFFKQVQKAIIAKQATERIVVANQETLFLNGVSGGEHVSRTTEGDMTERGMIRLWESISNLDEKLTEYCELTEAGLNAMDHLTNPMMYAIVHMRYFEHMKPYVVARKLNISQRQETRLHSQAMCIMYTHVKRWREMARR